jgi:photosystem II stability/assembly factor-like uncharacterized protein
MTIGFVNWSRLCRGRSVLSLAKVLTCFACFGVGNWAHADDSIEVELNQPAAITPRAQSGLFTSVTRAGSRLVAAGERGRIILSDDNGKTWHQIPTPTSVTLTAIRFATGKIGWAVGQMGVVLHTVNGGETWSKQLDGVKAGDLMLTAANTEIARHGINDTTSADLQAAQEIVVGGANIPFLAIFPQSSSNIMIAGAYGMAFDSADGGESWQPVANDLQNPQGLHIYSLISDNRTIFAFGEQGLALQGGFGQPFVSIPIPFQGTLFGSLIAVDGSIIAFGLQGTVLRSNNKGGSWKKISSDVADGIDCGVLLQNHDILLGDVAGDILFSEDNGQTFTVNKVAEPVVSLVQAADGTVIAAGPLGMIDITAASLKMMYND